MKFLALTFALFAASVGAMQEKTRGGLLLADNAARAFTIRLCNAYAYHLPLDVKKGDVSVLSTPIAYRECRDVSSQEDTGDKLDFYVQSTPPVKAGTFAVSDLPTENKRSVLLLVVHRADAGSTAMAFQSHVFAPLKNSQIAVLDGYKGEAEGVQLRIEDHPEAGKVKAGLAKVRSEDLKYNSVVAVNPGHYTVRLTMTAGHKLVDMKELVALNKESYVLLRVGLHPTTEGAVSYPEELLVFPNTDRNALSGAGRGVASVVSVAAVLVSLVFAWL